jgi:hypothetical protein
LEEEPELKKALEWMDLADQYSDNFTLIETRAGLFYKMGKVKEGIEWQNKALAVFNEQMAAAKITSEKSLSRITENLAKMKAGEPTW